MPVSRPIINLDPWSTFLPKERSDDYEYNLLLYKFKSLFKEVSDFCEAHSECSVSRSSSTEFMNTPLTSAIKTLTNKIQSNNLYGQDSPQRPQNVSTPVSNLRPLKGHKNNLTFLYEDAIDDLDDPNIRPSVSKEVISVAGECSSKNSDLIIKSRRKVPDPHLPRSNDRLDIINNNNINNNNNNNTSIDNNSDTANNNGSSKSLRSVHCIKPFRQIDERTRPVAKDNASYEDEDNIYDAVTNDDVSKPEQLNYSVASSIQNFDRMASMKKEPNTSSSLFNRSTTHNQPSVNLVFKERGNAFNNIKPSSNKTKDTLGSSMISDKTNASSSSLSAIASMPNNDSSNEYSNYVNIDYFLKKSRTPSFDGLDESVTNDEADEDDNENGDEHEHVGKDDVQEEEEDDDDDDDDDYLAVEDEDENYSLDDSTSTRESPSFPSISSITDKRANLMVPKQSASFDQGHKNTNALEEARNTMKTFLSDLNLTSTDDVLEDKAQRRIVKESFVVEFCGRRKLRHLFLFNDVIVCAKYQASSKQKFTFDVKWYLTLGGITIPDIDDTKNHLKYDKEATENQILTIRTNLMVLRNKILQLKRSKSKQPSKMMKKLKKKRTEMEAQLVILLPHLPLILKHKSGKKFAFFMSSNFDRNQWVDSIKFLQTQKTTSKAVTTSPSSSELQAWIQTCRKNLNPSLGTFLLRSNSDDDLLYGDLNLILTSIEGINKLGNYYFCFEIDSYGHFSQKASSPVIRLDSTRKELNEEYMFPLDGAYTLRILVYEDLGSNTKPSLVGKAHVELNHVCVSAQTTDKCILFNLDCSLQSKFTYSSSELLSSRIPHYKLCPTFGMDITQVCKKERTDVPLLIQLCVNEVERRGMREVGIYRMSGTSTDVHRLRKAFETNPYTAELLLRDIDINSVTGFLKTYLREMPEGLFINRLYLRFVAAFNIPQSESLKRTEKMLELFHKIPPTNQNTIIYLVEHLVKVNKYESHNKMSLTNLATVLGPNILRPPSESTGQNASDPFTAVVIGSMSQAGILYFFLDRKLSNLPLTELDSSEANRLRN